jgi:hypothetical protein
MVIVAMPYVYSGKADKSKTFNTVKPECWSKCKRIFDFVAVRDIQEEKILGGQPYIGIGWGPGANTTSASISVTNPNTEFNRSNSSNGSTDIYPAG